MLTLAPSPHRLEFGNNAHVEYSEDTSGNQIKVYREDKVLFSATIISNAFFLRVPSEYSYPETLLFSEIRQEGKKIQKLASSRKLPEGRIKTVEYDMESGDIDLIFLSSPEMGIEVFDKDGNSVEIDQSEQNAAYNRGGSAASI